MREWLVSARKVKGLSQIDMSKRLHLTQPTYWAYESGKARPKPDTAKRIASILGIDWTRFYDEPAP